MVTSLTYTNLLISTKHKMKSKVTGMSLLLKRHVKTHNDPSEKLGNH